MIQHTDVVYVNEIDFDDGGVACMFDPFVITTYVGKHVVSCEATMLGERHGVGMVVPRSHVRGMSDLNVLHQEVMAKSLRCEGIVYIDLEYHKVEQVSSKFH